MPLAPLHLVVPVWLCHLERRCDLGPSDASARAVATLAHPLESPHSSAVTNQPNARSGKSAGVNG